MENLTTNNLDSVLESGHFVMHQGEVHCIRVTCEGCEHITRCKNEPAEIDISLKTNIRRAIAPSKAPKGEYVGDTTKVVIKTFKNKPFETNRILYNWETKNYVCVSGNCAGCEHIKECKPEINVQESNPVVWSSDLKGQEPRCYAMLSSEPNWVGLFQNDSIRSTPYMYEAVSSLFDYITETSKDKNFWIFLDKNYFEERTDLYQLVTCILKKDTERFTLIASFILTMFAKEYSDYRKDVQELVDILPSKLDELNQKLTNSKVLFPPVGDFHGANAVAMFGEDEVKEAFLTDYGKFKGYYRDRAKRCGLALNYGGTAFMLKRNLDISDSEADKIFDKYFATLNVFKNYLDKAWRSACKNLFIRTMVGRRIYITELGITERAKMWIKMSEGKNNVYNYPIQGSSGEMVRIMTIKAYKFMTDFKTTKYDINYAAKTVQNTNILYTDVTSIHLEEISSLIDKAPLGNVMILIVNSDGEVIQQGSRSIKIKWADADRLGLKELM